MIYLIISLFKLEAFYYQVKRLLGFKIDTSCIPEGEYCRKFDKENYDVIICPYYKFITKEDRGCTYLNCITDNPVFADMCKLCNENKLD